MFIACRLTDEIREDPQKPCTKKWDQPSEGGRHFEPLILELNLTRFSTFVPGPRDTRNDPFLANFWPKTDTRLSSHSRCYPKKKEQESYQK